jgi:histone H3/H4
MAMAEPSEIVAKEAVNYEDQSNTLIASQSDDVEDGDVDNDYNDTEEEKDDCFADDNEIPSQGTPEITGSSDEPEMVESKSLSTFRASKKRKATSPKEIQENSTSEKLMGSRNKKHSSSGMAVCRTPSVNGLTIPFRTIKKAMKLDPDIPIVQNEAAIMTTVAVELFLKRLVVKSNQNAKNRGRNTVRYEDVAEARTADKALSFLEPLLP